MAKFEQCYTKYSIKPSRGAQGYVTIFEAGDMFGEVDWCVNSILKLCREEGYRMRQIAVACANEDVKQLALTIFKQSNIPCYCSQKRIVADNQAVKMLMNALNIFIKNWSYEAVFAYLKLGYARVDSGDIDLLENYVLAAGIYGKIWVDEDKWNYKTSVFGDGDEDEDFFQRINDIRHKIIAPLLKLREQIGVSHTLRDACVGVYEFLCELQVFDKNAKMAAEFENRGMLDLADEYSRVWDIIMEVLDQAVLICGDEKIGMQAFFDLLTAGFMKQQSASIPQGADMVILCDVLNARTCDCRALFVLGANSMYFPLPPTDQGILGDDDRLALFQQGIDLAPTAPVKALDERFLAYKALTKPSEKLYVSYSASDMDGKGLAPSPVIDTIKRIFSDVECEYELSKTEEFESITTTAATEELLASDSFSS